MTPTGLVWFYCIGLASVVWPSRALALACLLVLSFVASSGLRRLLMALRRSLVVVLPTAVLLYLVWVVVMGEAPSSSLAGAATDPHTYVAIISLKLFLVVLLTTAISHRATQYGTLPFILQMAIPAQAKYIALATLAAFHTITSAAVRARTALIAANLVSPKPSLRNLANAWRFTRTSWISTLGTTLERLDTKWKYEEPFRATQSHLHKKLNRFDLLWLITAASVLIIEVFSTQL